MTHTLRPVTKRAASLLRSPADKSVRSRTPLLGLAGLVATLSLTFSVSLAAADAGPRATINASAAAAACSPKQETIKGRAAIVHCGPATAKVKYNGKTYSFKNGTCEKAGSQVIIDLGTSLIDQGKGNGGLSYVSLTIFSKSQPMQIYAFSGSLSVSGSGKLSGTGTKGTFSGMATVADFKSVNKPLTGSWNCGK